MALYAIGDLHLGLSVDKPMDVFGPGWANHVERLQAGKCTIELGFVLSDILTNYERISDHCSNIAVCVIEEHSHEMDRHAYIHELKAGGAFRDSVRRDLRKYQLPPE